MKNNYNNKKIKFRKVRNLVYSGIITKKKPKLKS